GREAPDLGDVERDLTPRLKESVKPRLLVGGQDDGVVEVAAQLHDRPLPVLAKCQLHVAHLSRDIKPRGHECPTVCPSSAGGAAGPSPGRVRPRSLPATGSNRISPTRVTTRSMTTTSGSAELLVAVTSAAAMFRWLVPRASTRRLAGSGPPSA